MTSSPDPRPRRSVTSESTRKLTRREGSERSASHRAATATKPQSQAKPQTQVKPARGYLQAVRRFLHGAIFDNGSIKLVALVLAITVYILVNTEKDQVIGVNVGVTMPATEDRVLVSEPVDHVRITIRGSRRQIKRFDEREIERIHIPLSAMRTGEFVFQEDMIRLPPGLELLSINPPSVHLQFEKKISKSVPVVIETVGTPASGFKVERKQVTPAHVTVRGAESAVTATDEIHTVQISLDNHRESFRDRVALVAPEGHAQIVDNPQVDVDITLVEELEKRELGLLPVAIRAGTGPAEAIEGWVTEPAQVRVALHGSRAAIEAAVQRGVAPYVKVFPTDLVGKERKAEVLLDVEGVGPEIEPREVLLKHR